MTPDEVESRGGMGGGDTELKFFPLDDIHEDNVVSSIDDFLLIIYWLNNVFCKLSDLEVI